MSIEKDKEIIGKNYSYNIMLHNPDMANKALNWVLEKIDSEKGVIDCIIKRDFSENSDANNSKITFNDKKSLEDIKKEMKMFADFFDSNKDAIKSLRTDLGLCFEDDLYTSDQKMAKHHYGLKGEYRWFENNLTTLENLETEKRKLEVASQNFFTRLFKGEKIKQKISSIEEKYNSTLSRIYQEYDASCEGLANYFYDLFKIVPITITNPFTLLKSNLLSSKCNEALEALQQSTKGLNSSEIFGLSLKLAQEKEKNEELKKDLMELRERLVHVPQQNGFSEMQEENSTSIRR